MPPTVLIVEDERTLAEVLADNLQDEGYRTLHAADGSSGLRCWQDERPNLVILDVMLPRMSGFEVCRTMRGRGDTTPVLFLSAKGQVEDRVEGLRAGGDDYLPKPFHLPEFLLRVENMLRRQRWGVGETRQETDDTLRFGGHKVDFRAWTATLAGGRQEPLGERELKILRLLSSRQNEVVSRDEILDTVWGDDAFPSSRTVDNFVMRLRRLFEPDPASPVYFHTVWGVGYRFTPAGTQVEAR
ncbi:MAG: Two-component transcriptional response regulator, winged helix family [uncultured Truepera sp.]|uniref:Two-component transcriptional response regulator, winged helix family n=1 Tax=uncultured Truepera sp. TaxID=543023 RepID=A0A6J4VFI2_9DEIN|nr:MAG: Two-component transcriptional response regulator, winged helix family [uncultured Truepera sp.]